MAVRRSPWWAQTLPSGIKPLSSAPTRDWRTIHVLEETAGKVRVIAALPSIDTPMCDLEGQKFNEAATATKAALDV